MQEKSYGDHFDQHIGLKVNDTMDTKKVSITYIYKEPYNQQ